MLIFILFVIFLAWYAYKRHTATVQDQKQKDEYWIKEDLANATRKQDLSSLPFITVQAELLPMGSSVSEKVTECEAAITDLLDKKILNLTGITNTDLKSMYGAGNLNYLSECDQNFTLLSRTLAEWGNALYEEGLLREAVTVLEFGVSCRSDVSANYLLLAKLYQETGQSFKIQNLLDTASQLNSLSKNRIIASLSEFCQTGI